MTAASVSNGERPLSDAERRQRAEMTAGEPLLESETARSPYLDYEHIDTLLSLQQPRTAAPAEMCFYVMGQVKELLFKLLYVEFRRVADELEADQLQSALWTFRRAYSAQRLLVHTWEVLRSLSPTDFAEFRDELGAASGVQSFMYRRLEFVLGNKSLDMVRPHLGVPEIADDLLTDLNRPSLYDEALRLLARHGADIPDEHLRRDPATPYQPHPAVELAWAKAYADPELRHLAEAMSDAAYQFSQWRAIHLLVVEKMIGNKPGSGASSGLGWLRKVSEHRHFPELWAARNHI